MKEFYDAEFSDDLANSLGRALQTTKIEDAVAVIEEAFSNGLNPNITGMLSEIGYEPVERPLLAELIEFFKWEKGGIAAWGTICAVIQMFLNHGFDVRRNNGTAGAYVLCSLFTPFVDVARVYQATVMLLEAGVDPAAGVRYYPEDPSIDDAIGACRERASSIWTFDKELWDCSDLQNIALMLLRRSQNLNWRAQGTLKDTLGKALECFFTVGDAEIIIDDRDIKLNCPSCLTSESGLVFVCGEKALRFGGCADLLQDDESLKMKRSSPVFYLKNKQSIQGYESNHSADYKMALSSSEYILIGCPSWDDEVKNFSCSLHMSRGIEFTT